MSIRAAVVTFTQGCIPIPTIFGAVGNPPGTSGPGAPATPARQRRPASPGTPDPPARRPELLDPPPTPTPTGPPTLVHEAVSNLTKQSRWNGHTLTRIIMGIPVRGLHHNRLGPTGQLLVVIKAPPRWQIISLNQTGQFLCTIPARLKNRRQRWPPPRILDRPRQSTPPAHRIDTDRLNPGVYQVHPGPFD